MKKIILTSSLLALAPLAAQAAESTYGITEGSGTTMNSVTVGGNKIPASVISDAVAPTQHWNINATGQGVVTLPDGGSVTLGAKADAATCATTNTLLACLRQLHNDMIAAIPTGTNNIGLVTSQGRVATAEPAAGTDGAIATVMLTKNGRQVMSPYTVPELYVRGTVTVTASANTLLAASGVGGQFTYLVSMECGNDSATNVWANLSDSAGSYVLIPAGGGNNPRFDPPLVSSAANTAITLTGSTTVTNVRCAAQGYKGP